MSTSTVYIIQLLFMILIGIWLLYTFVRIRRLGSEMPSDPKVARLVKFRWIFIFGIACSFISAAVALALLLRDMR